MADRPRYAIIQNYGWWEAYRIDRATATRYYGAYTVPPGNRTWNPSFISRDFVRGVVWDPAIVEELQTLEDRAQAQIQDIRAKLRAAQSEIIGRATPAAEEEASG